jgi:hypothetical protein
MEKMSKWISVKDRLPEKDNEDWYIIVLTRERRGREAKRIVRVGYWDCYHKRFWGFEAGFDYTVTHWMPLPEPPKELVCQKCGERFTDTDLQEFREMGEAFHREKGFFLCPDCWDDFQHLTLEEQMVYLWK